jgi:hypothetical protein
MCDERFATFPNVEFLADCDVAGLTSDLGRERITGARVVRHGDGVETLIAADLVADATGRGSRTPVFLDDCGYRRPTKLR